MSCQLIKTNYSQIKLSLTLLYNKLIEFQEAMLTRAGGVVDSHSSTANPEKDEEGGLSPEGLSSIHDQDRVNSSVISLSTDTPSEDQDIGMNALLGRPTSNTVSQEIKDIRLSYEKHNSSNNTSDSDSVTVTDEIEVCPVCNVLVEDGVFCEGSCATWFHPKCVKITSRKFKQLTLSRQEWYCNACAKIELVDFSSLTWGSLEGLSEISERLDSVYNEIVQWENNTFFLPRGKVGRDFVNELCVLLDRFNIKSAWEPVALSMFTVFVPIMLQRPSLHSKAKENAQYLAERLQKWKAGELDWLMNQCRAIQSKLKGERVKKTESVKKAFCRLMFEGKVAKATRLIDENEGVSGVVEINDKTEEHVLKELRNKHPPAKDVDPSCIVTPPTIPFKVEPVIFEAIDAELIYECARSVTIWIWRTNKN